MLKVRRVASLVLISGALAIPGGVWAQAPAAAPAAAAPAGDFAVLPLAAKMYSGGQETAEARTLGRNVAKVLGGEMALGDEPLFDVYYTHHLFAMYTQTDAKSLAKLPRERSNFLRNHLQKTRRPEIHDHLVQLTLRSMKDIATKNYHPAVRYHAMMLIGELNSKEMTTPGPNGTPPVPLPEARDFMLAELGNAKQIDAVRVAALLGILRHAEISAYGAPLAPPVRQAIVKVILPLATDKNVPADRSPEGHAWMRGRAVEVLAFLGRPQFDAPLVQTLTTIMADSNEPLGLRFTALTSLGKMNLSGATNFTGDQLARQMAMLAVQATRDQLSPIDDQLAAEKEKLRLGGGGPGGYGGGYSGGGERGYSPSSGYPGGMGAGTVVKTPQQLKEEARLTIIQRVLKDHMLKTRIGLDGADGKSGAVTAAKAASQKDYIKKVSDAVTALAKVSDMKDPRIDGPPRLVDLAKEMRAKMMDLDRIAKTGGAPAAPAAAPEGPEGPEGPAAEGPGTVSAVPGESPDATAAVAPARSTP